MFTEHGNALFELLFAHILCAAENYATCIFNLIVEKFSEVFHIQSAFSCIDDSGEAVENDFIIRSVLNCGYNVAKLAYP